MKQKQFFPCCWPRPFYFGTISSASAAEPKYKADVPKSLITPDKVQTELLGELEFTDGMPSEATVKKTYDFIDLSRAVDAFLNGIPATSIYAMLEGLKQAGAEPGDLVLWEESLGRPEPGPDDPDVHALRLCRDQRER